jgi:hypothetical protein
MPAPIHASGEKAPVADETAIGSGVARRRPGDLRQHARTAEADLVKTLELAGATALVGLTSTPTTCWSSGRTGDGWAVDVKDWPSPYPLGRKLQAVPTYPDDHELACNQGFIVTPDDRVGSGTAT